jgi:uncharacterized membrane protein YczE
VARKEYPVKTAEKNKITLSRIICVIAGVTIISIGLTFMRYAAFGVDPVTCLNLGIAKKLGMSFGTWQLIMSIILLVGVFLSDRGKVGFGTLYNMVVIGYTSDILLWFIGKIPLFDALFLLIRIISFIFGFLVLYFGAAVYIEANMGISPYDAVAIIIVEKIKRQNLFRWIRIGTDALCVIGGILAQSNVGIGTLLTVLFAGPLIALYRKLLMEMKIFKGIK